MDTLKYLIRGGRAPKTAIIADLLNIRPFIGLVNDSGLVASLGKARGKRKAFNRLVEMVEEHADISKPLHIMAHYSGNIEDGEQLREMVTSRYNVTEIYMTELTPVMTTHTGPSVGLSFYS